MPKGIRTAYISLPPVNEREVLRYAGVKGEADGVLSSSLAECVREITPALAPKVCYTLLTKEELFAAIPSARKSEGLRAVLEGDRVVLFAATLGLAVDRLIARYAAVAPSKAVLSQAIGAERIEALCDCFCANYEKTLPRARRLGKRFSPGYGDFPLLAQRELFHILQCEKNVGLTLTDGLMMSPTKSVTAIVGVTDDEGDKIGKKACEDCRKTDCGYRK